MTGSWECGRCGKLAVELPDGKRGSEGHERDLCAACSIEQAEMTLEFCPRSIRWYVARLKEELAAERTDHHDDIRYYERNTRET